MSDNEMNLAETRHFLESVLNSLGKDLWAATLKARGERDVRDIVAHVCQSYADQLGTVGNKSPIGFVRAA